MPEPPNEELAMTSTSNSSGSGTQKSASVENPKFVLPEGLVIPDQNYVDEDGVLHVDITEEASISLSPYQVRDSQDKSQDPAFNSFVNIGVSPSEAHFLIQNAHMAFLAAEKAAACRIHAETNGTTCEVLNHQINDLKNYVTSLQNRIVSLSSDKDEAINAKQEAESKLEELKIQYDAVVSQRLEQVGKAKEASKLQEDYDKSQTVLNEMVKAYSNLKEQYSEAIKIASVFAKERDSAQTQYHDINIQCKRLQLENEVRISNAMDVVDSFVELARKTSLQIPEDLRKKIDNVKRDGVSISEFENDPVPKKKTKKDNTRKRRTISSGDRVSQSGQSEASIETKGLEAMLIDFVEPSIPEPATSPQKSPLKVSGKSNEQSSSKIAANDMDLVISDDSSAEEDIVETVNRSPVQKSPRKSPKKSNEPNLSKTMDLNADLMLSEDSSAEEDNGTKTAETLSEVQSSPSMKSPKKSKESSSLKQIAPNVDLMLPESSVKEVVTSTVTESPSVQISSRKSPMKSDESSSSKTTILNADLILSEESAVEEEVPKTATKSLSVQISPRKSPMKPAEQNPPKNVISNTDLIHPEESRVEEVTTTTMKHSSVQKAPKKSPRKLNEFNVLKNVHNANLVLPEETGNEEQITKSSVIQKTSPRKSLRKQNQSSPSKTLAITKDLALSEESSAEEDSVVKIPKKFTEQISQRKQDELSKLKTVTGGVNTVIFGEKSKVEKTTEKIPSVLKKLPPVNPRTAVRILGSTVKKPVLKSTKGKNDLLVFAKEAQPPSMLNSKSTAVAGVVPSIHGRKTMTVREMQQQMMMKDKKEILEKLRKEQENMPVSKPLQKKVTVSIVQKSKKNEEKVDGKNPQELVIPLTSNVEESNVEKTQETTTVQEKSDPSASNTGRMATRSSIAPKRGQSMAQIMRNLSSRTKMRLATSGSIAPVSTVDSGTKKRGRKTNAEKAATLQNLEKTEVPQDGEQPVKRKYTRKKKSPEISEEVTVVESVGKKRKRIISDDEEDGNVLEKEGPSSSVQSGNVQRRITRKSSKRDPVLELKGLLQKCTRSKVPVQVSEFLSWAPDELEFSDVVEAVSSFMMKLNTRNCWSLLDDYDGNAVVSEEEESILRLCNELSGVESWRNLTREIFCFMAKKQLSTVEKLNTLEVNRNYRLLFALIEVVNMNEKISDIEVNYQDSLLDNLVLNRSPEAVITTICYLLTISPILIKKFIVKRVIEDTSGYSDLLVTMVHECSNKKQILNQLVTEKAEIDFETCKLNENITVEDYSNWIYSKIGDIYFTDNGLSGFDMDGEMIFSISPNIQKKTSLVAALFSPEIFEEFNRIELIEKGMFFIKFAIESVSEEISNFNDLFYDKINEGYFDRDLNPLDPGNVDRIIQLLYVLTRLVSIPFRRLQKSHLPKYAKIEAEKFLNQVSSLEEFVQKCDYDSGWKQRVNFGLKDAIDHLRLSMK